MRVFIAGATGVLGRRLVQALAEDGHEVIGLTRDEAGDRRVSAAGGQPRRGDLLEPATLLEAAEGCRTLVHAATAIPTRDRPTPEDWARNDAVRRQGTRALLQAADQVGAEHVVLESVAWLPAREDGAPYEERATPRPTELTRSALDAERLVHAAADRQGVVGTVLRCGVFYAPDAHHTREMATALAERKMPVIARGVLGRGQEGVLAPLHVDDAARAFQAAVTQRPAGTFHVVDDQPVELSAYLEAFAEALGAPAPRRVPAWLARLIVGRALVEYLTTQMRTQNAAFRAATGWQPSYPTYREGLAQVVEAWRSGPSPPPGLEL